MTMLHCAIKFDRRDIAKLLLKHGADISIATKNGDTALIYACYYLTASNEKGAAEDDAETIKLLLAKGADAHFAGRRNQKFDL